MHTQIVPIGNSFGLRLPRHVLDALRLEKSSELTIQLRKDSIVLRPAPKRQPAAPRAGWFDSPADKNDGGLNTDGHTDEQKDWLALDTALLSDPVLDAEWQW